MVNEDRDGKKGRNDKDMGKEKDINNRKGERN